MGLLISGCGAAERMQGQCTGDLSAVCKFFIGSRDEEQDAVIDGLTKEIARLDGAIKDNRIDIALLQSALNTTNMQLAITMAVADNNTLQLNSLATTLNAQIVSLQNEIVALTQADVITDTLLTSITNDIVVLQGQVSSINTTLTLNNTQIVSLQNSLTVNVNNLQTQIDSLQTTTNDDIVNIYTIINGVNDVAAIVDPCGDSPGWDEVLLRLADGSIVASFSDNASGLNTRFTVIPHNSSQVYSTTDGTSCGFKVMNDGLICWGAAYAICL